MTDPAGSAGTSETPALLFFDATWSTPGRLMAPAAEKTAADMGWSFVHHQVDREPGLVRRYGLRGLPALLLIDGEREVRRWTGFHAENEIRRELADLDKLRRLRYNAP